MSNSFMIFLLIIISTSQSVSGSYHYGGCYSQVFYDSFFTSSFMEPTLCFRLCDTPIIYLQKTVCRCSGGGLMHHNRQHDNYCLIPCSKAADRQVKTANTCGGSRTYSVYVEEQFYIRHGHLFHYQIQFSSCELWIDARYSDKFSVKLDEKMIKSSLNKLEQFVAACLDKDARTKSIAFNGDNNQCLCILSSETYSSFISHVVPVLPNNSCNHYCNNASTNKFQCGSFTNSSIWAKYDLDGACPDEHVYVKEIKKCMYKYAGFQKSCASPAINYIYDGSISWSSLLKILEQLNLLKLYVSIDFAENVVINSSWECGIKTTLKSGGFGSSYYRPTYLTWNSSKRYMIFHGCLRERFIPSNLLNHLCITNPINKYSISSEDYNTSSYINAIDPQIQFCPTKWFDLNGRCYRVSDERKTIEEARRSCITISNNDKSHLWSYDDHDDDEDVHDLSAGSIVQYSSPWQARVGFFLLDTIPENELTSAESALESLNSYYQDLASLVSNETVDRLSTNEFQMINPIDNKNQSNIMDLSCIVSIRTILEEYERPILSSIQVNNCSKPRYVLCETKTLIIRNYQQGCFQKPLTFDLPALISNVLTYELCLSICQELQTKLAIIHINKCYCLDGFTSKSFNLTTDLEEYQQKNCGNPCLGNQNELCGNEDTIVVFDIFDSRRTYIDASTPAEPFPDFVYDGCINVNSFDPTTTYQFNLTNLNNSHPRHCLELCTNYQTKYALMNSNKCFCTDIPIKDEQYNADLLSHEDCSQKCAANYFYTCGNRDNSTVYSMYIMQPKCRHGYEVAENDQQCVYSHLSTKKKSFYEAQSYCKSIDGVIAKINDMLEIQDILPESILKARLFKLYPYIYHLKDLSVDRTYFWINRTLDIPDNNTISHRLLDKCSQTSENIDRNCISIQYEETSYDNVSNYEQCISESNECSLQSAMPICVDQHLENNSTIILPITEQKSVNTSIDYSCGDDKEYNFVDDYCYKISFHEVTWNEAKSECERDNATLFVPEKSVTLHIIKSLFLRQNTYTQFNFAHVGVIYNNQNRTVTTDKSIIPDSNAVYDLCEKTFHERYRELTNQQIGCGYIDLLLSASPVIRCDEIPCNRTATVICQKLPIVKTDVVKAKRVVYTSTDDSITMVSSEEYSKSIGRDFAPIFFVLGIIFALILLGIISTLYNHRLSQKNNNTVYSQLTTANEFDLT